MSKFKRKDLKGKRPTHVVDVFVFPDGISGLNKNKTMNSHIDIYTLRKYSYSIYN